MQETPQDVTIGSESRTSAPAPQSARFKRIYWNGGIFAVLVLLVFTVIFVTARRAFISLPLFRGGTACLLPRFPESLALNDFAMVSPTEGWAVGEVGTSDGTSGSGVIMHDVGGQWQQIAGNFAGLSFTSIAMTSATNGWLTGIYPAKSPDGNTVFQDVHVLYHYDGHSWQPVAFDQSAFDQNFGGTPGDLIVRMFSATDGWLMLRNTSLRGNYSLLHFDGSRWSIVASPYVSTDSSFYDFTTIQVSGPDEVWLAGPRVGLAHYQGGAWNEVAGFTGSADSLAMSVESDGWAIDSDANQVWRFTGQQAMPLALPKGILQSNEKLTSLSAAPDGTIWVVGNADTVAAPAPFLLHRLANGTWQRNPIPYAQVFVNEVRFATANDIWGIGATTYQQMCNGAPIQAFGHAVILHWDGSRWSSVI